MMFFFGDCSQWLITTPDAVNGENYANEGRLVLKSSSNPGAHRVKWYNRAKNAEDPWVSMQDHHHRRDPPGPDDMLYGEGSKSGHEEAKNAHGGANVWIREPGGLGAVRPHGGFRGSSGRRERRGHRGHRGPGAGA